MASEISTKISCFSRGRARSISNEKTGRTPHTTVKLPPSVANQGEFSLFVSNDSKRQFRITPNPTREFFLLQSAGFRLKISTNFSYFHRKIRHLVSTRNPFRPMEVSQSLEKYDSFDYNAMPNGKTVHTFPLP